MLKEADNELGEPKVSPMQWPQREKTAMCEFKEKVFCNSFPWLFPGGIGDIVEHDWKEKLEVEAWASNLLYYEDG